MEPISAFSIVQTCGSILLGLNNIVTILKSLANTQKNVALEIKVIANDCHAVCAVVARIKGWLEIKGNNGPKDEGILWQQLRKTIEIVHLLVAIFADEANALLRRPMMGFFRKTAVSAWTLPPLKEQQKALQGQAIVLNLLLTGINLPTTNARNELVNSNASVFQRASETVRTIVNSNGSLSTWRTTTTRRSAKDVLYKHLSFEDQLFTSSVYKRSYRHNATRPKVMTDLKSVCPRETNIYIVQDSGKFRCSTCEAETQKDKLVTTSWLIISDHYSAASLCLARNTDHSSQVRRASCKPNIKLNVVSSHALNGLEYELMPCRKIRSLPELPAPFEGTVRLKFKMEGSETVEEAKFYVVPGQNPWDFMLSWQWVKEDGFKLKDPFAKDEIACLTMLAGIESVSL